MEDDEGVIGWGGQHREGYNERERGEGQNLLTFLPSCLAVLPKGENSKWVMGQFMVGSHITEQFCVLMRLGHRNTST